MCPFTKHACRQLQQSWINENKNNFFIANISINHFASR